MADALRRDQILAAIVTRLKTILKGSGYATDAGRNVFLWRMTPLGPGEVPGLVVQDPNRRVAYEYDDNVRDYELDIVVLGMGTSGNPDDLGLVCDDIYKAMLTVDRTFGGVVNDVVPDGDEKIYDQQASRIGGIAVRFKARYRNV